MNFYVGFHHPGSAHKVERPVMVSINALRGRKSDFDVGPWIMDSGAYTQNAREAGFHESPAEYAIEIARWSRCGELRAAASQDYMCDPAILDRMDRTAREQQERTTKRYQQIRSYLRRIGCEVHLMPVLQGWMPEHFRRHLAMYDLPDGCWTGVGSIVSKSDTPAEIERVLDKIKSARPDLRLHGFGLKETALSRPYIRDLLYSADSMAWSYAARREGRDPNDPAEARSFYDDLTTEDTTAPLFTT